MMLNFKINSCRFFFNITAPHKAWLRPSDGAGAVTAAEAGNTIKLCKNKHSTVISQYIVCDVLRVLLICYT